MSNPSEKINNKLYDHHIGRRKMIDNLKSSKQEAEQLRDEMIDALDNLQQTIKELNAEINALEFEDSVIGRNMICADHDRAEC